MNRRDNRRLRGAIRRACWLLASLWVAPWALAQDGAQPPPPGDDSPIQVKREGPDLRRALADNPSIVPLPPRFLKQVAEFATDAYFSLPLPEGAAVVAYVPPPVMEGDRFSADVVGNFSAGRMQSLFEPTSGEATFGLQFEIKPLDARGKAPTTIRLARMQFIGGNAFTAQVSYPPRTATSTVFYRCEPEDSGGQGGTPATPASQSERQAFVCRTLPAVQLIQSGRDAGLFDRVRKRLEQALGARPSHLLVQARRGEEPRRFTTVYFRPPDGPRTDARVAAEYAARENLARQFADALRPITGAADVREWEWNSDYALHIVIGTTGVITAPGGR